MPKPITNRQRAKWALEALRTHYSIREGRVSGEEILEDLETNAVDLVSDLFHLLNQNKISPNKVVASAGMHYNAEAGARART
jgi:hypothetical protein